MVLKNSKSNKPKIQKKTKKEKIQQGDKFPDEKANSLNIKSKALKDYIIKKISKDYDKLCKDSTITLNNVQKFLAYYFNKQNKILLYHGIGSGKTLTAINIAEENMKNLKDKDGFYTNICYVITKASLVDSFKNELLKWDFNFGKSFYIEDKHFYFLKKRLEKKIYDQKDISAKDKQLLNYCNRVINNNIKTAYKIMSYEKFSKNASRLCPNKNDIIIIDEVTNIISENSRRYTTLMKWLSHYPENPMILLTGTPIYDNYKEFFQIINLLIPLKQFNYDYYCKLVKSNLKKDQNDAQKIVEKLLKFVSNHVSYFEPSRNPDNVIYPHYELKEELCTMSDYQSEMYMKILKKEQKVIPYKTYVASLRNPSILENYEKNHKQHAFYLEEKKIANVANARPLYKEEAIQFYTPENIKKVSCKFSRLIKNIIDEIKYEHGKIIIYSQFVNNYGIAGIKKFLNAFEFHNYNDFLKLQRSNKKIENIEVEAEELIEDYNNYICITGKETQDQKKTIQDIFNNPDNADGKNIKIMIISPTANEGLNLFDVTNIHIMEMPWNLSLLKQIFGRGFRSCGQKNLAKKDRKLTIHMYYTQFNKKYSEIFKKEHKDIKDDKDSSIDFILQKILLKKAKQNQIFNNIMQKYSIDCKLFKVSNDIKKCQTSSNKTNVNTEYNNMNNITKIDNIKFKNSIEELKKII